MEFVVIGADNEEQFVHILDWTDNRVPVYSESRLNIDYRNAK